MTAVFRFVSLIGVLSAGFYVLYLTQARMSEPESLTENVPDAPAPVTLGAEGELSELSDTENPWEPVEAESPSSVPGAPDGTAQAEVFSATSKPASTVVSDAAPGSNGGLDFRDSADVEGGASAPGLGIVRAAMESSEPEKITLTAEENPFAEETTAQPAEAETPPAFETIDPFDDQPPASDKPSPKPETEPAEFDPFGENVKELKTPATEKTADKGSAEEFPPLESDPAQPKPSDAGTNTTPATKKPVTVADDPFAPFPAESPGKTNDADTAKPSDEAAPERKPAVSPDPFAEFPAETNPVANKPSEETKSPEEIKSPAPAKNPFGEPFPELKPVNEAATERKPPKPVESPTPTDDPFGERPSQPATTPATPAAFPDFPGELPATDKPMEEAGAPEPAKTLESGFDPFTKETPAPRLADKPDTPQPTVSYTHLTLPTIYSV